MGPTLYNNSAKIIKNDYIAEPELNPIQEIVQSKQLKRSTVKNEEKTFNSTKAQKKKEIELPLKENVKIKQNELETIKVQKIKSKKEPTVTSITNAKIRSRNIKQ